MTTQSSRSATRWFVSYMPIQERYLTSANGHKMCKLAYRYDECNYTLWLWDPLSFHLLMLYIRNHKELLGNLPGTGDTVIKQAVPPGGDWGIALCPVEACDLPKRGRLGCAIFASGGLRSRIPLYSQIETKEDQHSTYLEVGVLVWRTYVALSTNFREQLSFNVFRHCKELKCI